MARGRITSTVFADVSAVERQPALDTLVMAFMSDPAIRWFYSDPCRYLGHYGDFIEAFGGQAFDEGSAWRLGDFDAAAVWLGPDSQLDADAIVHHLEATVAPEKQGQGLGGELLARCLEIVDQEHAPVYLDNTNPANIPFYERHGFRVTGESQAGACPPLLGMLRDAR